MNKTTIILLTIVFAVLLIGLFIVKLIDPERIETPLYLETSDTSNTPSTNADSEEKNFLYEDPQIGLSFRYNDTAQGYRLDTFPSQENAHVKTIVLTDKAEYEEAVASDIPREGPPTITIQVYRNDDREWSRAWADTHPEASNVNLLLGSVTETVVGGANAVRYTADGLYPTDTVVVAHGSYVYVISGAYLDETSSTRVDFEPLLRSIIFTPESV